MPIAMLLGNVSLACALDADTSEEKSALATTEGSADAVDPSRLRLFAQLGYAAQDDSDAGSYGVALGLKASYAPWGFIHTGLDGVFHVGSQFGDELNRVSYAGLELGARFDDRDAGLTPYLTSGLASVSSQRNVDPSYITWYLGLGFAFDVVVYDWLLLGAEGRAIFLNSVRQLDNSGVDLALDVLLSVGARL